jgi:hypothetical protein
MGGVVKPAGSKPDIAVRQAGAVCQALTVMCGLCVLLPTFCSSEQGPCQAGCGCVGVCCVICSGMDAFRICIVTSAEVPVSGPALLLLLGAVSLASSVVHAQCAWTMC